MQKQGCTDSFPLTEKNVSVASQALTSHSQPGVGTESSGSKSVTCSPCLPCIEPGLILWPILGEWETPSNVWIQRHSPAFSSCLTWDCVNVGKVECSVSAIHTQKQRKLVWRGEGDRCSKEPKILSKKSWGKRDSMHVTITLVSTAISPEAQYYFHPWLHLQTLGSSW